LAFLGLLPVAALAGVAFASCDSGGEPPENDSGMDSPPADGVVNNDVRTDTKMSEASLDGGDAAPCGDPGSACCTGDDVVPCSEGTTCTDKICQPKGCGELGHSCCVGDASPCQSGAACNGTEGGTICSSCGTSGNSCCPLNTCNDGGCCVSGNTCAAQGAACAGSTCMDGVCGTCGGPGGSCCSDGLCTAPGTTCVGYSPGVDAGPDSGGGSHGSTGECKSCGSAGDICCAGDCQTGLDCQGGYCRVPVSMDGGE
jgi:hypothetical protein